jgi:hypothetical protein
MVAVQNLKGEIIQLILSRKYMDGWTDGQTDRQDDSYIPPQTLFAGGIMKGSKNYITNYFFNLVWGMYHVSATPTKRLIEFL